LKFTKEIGIGILIIMGTLMSVFSYNYLKGINLFEKTRTFKVIYSKVDGLTPSNPVTLNGYKIGKVQKINFNSNNTKELIVDIIISNDVKFSKSSKAELYETGLIGGKAIAIIPDYNDTNIAKTGDYLEGILKPGLTELVNQILPQVQLQFETVMKEAEKVFSSFNSILDESTKKDLKNAVYKINLLSNSLSNASKNIDNLILDIKPNLNSTIKNLNSAALNINEISSKISNSKLDTIFLNLDKTISNLSKITNKINSGQGSIGELIYNDSLFNNIENLTKELDELIYDIKVNPSRYINISVFGKKGQDYKKRN
jgi:phospholipid/cholesterol/gamma-HCH transport system substrate-binding protein